MLKRPTIMYEYIIEKRLYNLIFNWTQINSAVQNCDFTKKYPIFPFFDDTFSLSLADNNKIGILC